MNDSLELAFPETSRPLGYAPSVGSVLFIRPDQMDATFHAVTIEELRVMFRVQGFDLALVYAWNGVAWRFLSLWVRDDHVRVTGIWSVDFR